MTRLLCRAKGLACRGLSAEFRYGEYGWLDWTSAGEDWLRSSAPSLLLCCIAKLLKHVLDGIVLAPVLLGMRNSTWSILLALFPKTPGFFLG